MPADVQVLGKVTPEQAEVLTPDALGFVAELARELEPTRRSLLRGRAARQAEFDAGELPDFLPETRGIRESAWRVPPPPPDLENRRVEITGPSSDRKMVINALNSGAQVYMTDFEDSHSPTWSGTLAGQANVRDAVRRTLRLRTPEGVDYRLGDHPATLTIRPRGLHLPERHVLVDGQPVSGSLFDFGLSFFHNARALLDMGSGPYYYLPKMESHLEARLWNDVFLYAEERLGVPRGSVRATVLIEHILAAFQMEEILYELREHASGLNLGRWDYIFSFIKTFSKRPWALLPDRAQVTMKTAFLRAGAGLLPHVCHKRGGQALGGMSAYIPRRDDAEANERALSQVRADKELEASEGYDGAWVAHPGLVPTVQEVFEQAFSGPNQLGNVPEVRVTAADLLEIPEGQITERGIRNNIAVSLRYLYAWLAGQGSVPIFNLMEDTATAEIARTQLWQWVHSRASVSGGRVVTPALYLDIRAEEVGNILEALAPEQRAGLDRAVDLLDDVVLSPVAVPFLTIPAYRGLE